MRVTNQEVTMVSLDGMVTNIMRNGYLSSYIHSTSDNYLKGQQIVKELGKDQLFQDGKKVTPTASVIANLKRIDEESIQEAMDQLDLSIEETKEERGPSKRH